MSLGYAEALRQERRRRGMQQGELAGKVGVTASYLSLLESGKRPPPSDEVTAKIEKALGLKTNQLLHLAHLARTPRDILDDLDRMQREGIVHKRAESVEVGVPIQPGLRSIPLINKVAAGYPSDFTDKGYPVGIADEYVSIPDIEDEHAFAVTVLGDSMEPRFHEGDVLIISPAEAIASGDVCFVRIDQAGESGSTIKQVWFDDEETVRLESQNPKYPSRVLSRDEIGGIYRAVRRLERL